MMNHKRASFLSSASKSIDAQVARVRAFKAAKNAAETSALRDALIAQGVIKPSTSTGMQRAHELCQAAIAEAK